MVFGIKKSSVSHLIGVKKAVNRYAGIGTKGLAVSEFLFPEFIPEIEGTKVILNKIKKLTK
jgi:hypothetical protein